MIQVDQYIYILGSPPAQDAAGSYTTRMTIFLGSGIPT